MSGKLRRQFLGLEDQLGSNFEILLNEKDLEHDLANGDFDLRVFFDGRSLLKEKRYPQNIKMEIYTLSESSKSLVTIVNRTVKNRKAAENIFFAVHLPRIESSTNLMFDVYDSHNVLAATFAREIVVNSSPDETTLSKIDGFDCSLGDGECLIEYMLRHITFSASYDNRLVTEVSKNDKGRYFVSIPIKKGRRIGKKVNGINVSGSKKGKITKFSDGYPFFEEGDQAGAAFWNDVRDAMEFGFTDTNKFFRFDSEGSLQLSSEGEAGFLNIGAGTPGKAAIVFEQGELLTDPVEGALEYDGNDLYFTGASGRTKIGAGGIGPQGPVGDTGPEGPIK